MKVVILGYGPMLTNLIAGCMDVGADIVGVFRYDRVRYPFLDRVLIDIFNPSAEYNYIKSHNLYEINARSANSAEFKKEVLRLNADIVLVGTWGEKLKKSIIELPKFGTINVHPALLPKYRGPNPYLQAILHMEAQTGVTFHLMDEKFDSGPILQQNLVEIAPTDTGEEVRKKAALAARAGIAELLKRLEEDVIIPLNQDDSRASYYPQIDEDEIMLDFSRPAAEVSAQIRAFHPWYKCYFRHRHHFFYPDPYKLEILENNTSVTAFGTEVGAIVEKSPKDKSITILCGDNKLIKMDNIRLYGFFNRFLTRFYIKNSVKSGVK